VRVSETLGVFSIEDFLRSDELATVLAAVDDHKTWVPPDRLRQTDRSTSVHSVPGIAMDVTMRAYEPAGRIELTPLPDAVVGILTGAARRALPAVRRVFPAASGCEAWTYVEYGAGQYITAHVDHPIEVQPDSGTPPAEPVAIGELRVDESGAHVAGISVVLNDGYGGGGFYVETSSSSKLWRSDRPELVNEGADHTSDWFPEIPRTRWCARPAAGGAVLYGTQLIHGTEPVSFGVVRKVIGFFTQ
jgi:hypothetical protein